jgi:hypothetical protein
MIYSAPNDTVQSRHEPGAGTGNHSDNQKHTEFPKKQCTAALPPAPFQRDIRGTYLPEGRFVHIPVTVYSCRGKK